VLKSEYHNRLGTVPSRQPLGSAGRLIVPKMYLAIVVASSSIARRLAAACRMIR
jgi:hypothetical protein